MTLAAVRPRPKKVGGGEGGYAMIMAVAAVAFFAMLALEATSGGRAAVVGASAEATRARLDADAEAGFALAAHGLGVESPGGRWNAAGDFRTVDFNGARLTIGVEDEAGKIPLNFILEPEIRRMFALAGATPARADALTEEFLSLRDNRPGDPRARDAASPHGPLTAIDELALLADMTPDLYARIAPQATVVATNLSFDPRSAKALALGVMAPDRPARPAFDGPAPAIFGERPALTIPPPAESGAESPATTDLAGRAFTVRVDVADRQGNALRRSAVIEITGSPAMPVVVRSID